ncbi:hypothetical protein KC357_g141 [Hortaea werneckii]|nr:hypothetical protein KC357_g141 [Hortaea werneckii]
MLSIGDQESTRPDSTKKMLTWGKERFHCGIRRSVSPLNPPSRRILPPSLMPWHPRGKVGNERYWLRYPAIEYSEQVPSHMCLCKSAVVVLLLLLVFGVSYSTLPTSASSDSQSRHLLHRVLIFALPHIALDGSILRLCAPICLIHLGQPLSLRRHGFLFHAPILNSRPTDLPQGCDIAHFDLSAAIRAASRASHDFHSACAHRRPAFELRQACETYLAALNNGWPSDDTMVYPPEVPMVASISSVGFRLCPRRRPKRNLLILESGNAGACVFERGVRGRQGKLMFLLSASISSSRAVITQSTSLTGSPVAFCPPFQASFASRPDAISCLETHQASSIARSSPKFQSKPADSSTGSDAVEYVDGSFLHSKSNPDRHLSTPVSSSARFVAFQVPVSAGPSRSPTLYHFRHHSQQPSALHACPEYPLPRRRLIGSQTWVSGPRALRYRPASSRLAAPLSHARLLHKAKQRSSSTRQIKHIDDRTPASATHIQYSTPVGTASDLNMSREQYVPPTLTQDNAQQGGASSTGVGGFNITGANTFEDNRPVNYLCGDCDAKVVLRKSEAIRCKECGYRVLYKERTNRLTAGVELDRKGKAENSCLRLDIGRQPPHIFKSSQQSNAVVYGQTVQPWGVPGLILLNTIKTLVGVPDERQTQSGIFASAMALVHRFFHAVEERMGFQVRGAMRAAKTIRMIANERADKVLRLRAQLLVRREVEVARPIDDLAVLIWLRLETLLVVRCAVFLAESGRQTKVRKLNMSTSVEQYVVRLDVAMNEAEFVYGLDRQHQLGHVEARDIFAKDLVLDEHGHEVATRASRRWQECHARREHLAVMLSLHQLDLTEGALANDLEGAVVLRPLHTSQESQEIARTYLSFLARARSTFSLKNSPVNIFCTLTRSMLAAACCPAVRGLPPPVAGEAVRW